MKIETKGYYVILNNNYAFGDLELKFLKSITYLLRLLYITGRGKVRKCGVSIVVSNE